MSSILITGGTGFLGRAIVDRLTHRSKAYALSPGDQYTRICIYSRGEHAQATMRAEFGDDARLRWFIGDVRDRERLRHAMEGVDDVIHAAALKRVEVGEYNPGEMVKTNIDGTMVAVSAAWQAAVERFVLVSSDKAVEPVNVYGATKMVAERIVLAENRSTPPHYSVVRYGNVAGSTGSVIPTWRAHLAAGQAPEVRDPDATRFWLTADTAVDLVFKALALPMGGTFVPTLPACKLGDLAYAMDIGIDGDPWYETSLAPGEKRHEVLSPGGPSSELARMMTVEELRAEIERLGL